MQYQIDRQREYFDTGATRPIQFRLDRLKALAANINFREQELLEALSQDLGKPASEAYSSEIGYVLRDIDHALRNLRRWMRPRRVRAPAAAWPGSARVVFEPLGTVLILAPWNYPLQLALSPLIAAVAAGNCVVLKPSELAPNTAAAIERVCAAAFETEHVSVLQGDGGLAAELTAMPFNHIFFTGSTRIGRLVAQAAAANLVPSTLELGGKSPCIVREDARLDLAARRIMWGKTMNAGQTCVAPDYLLVHDDIFDDFVARLAAVAEEFSADNYGSIVSGDHYERLCRMLDECEIYAGGQRDAKALKIKPAIILNPDPQSAVMQEEIFGPIMPVVAYSDFGAELACLRTAPAPLAAYLFTENRARIRDFIESVRTGSICVNDTVMQLFPADLPFGGVGRSGWGRYHGRAGFETFSNCKSVMTRSTCIDIKVRYPTSHATLAQLKRVYKWFMR